MNSSRLSVFLAALSLAVSAAPSHAAQSGALFSIGESRGVHNALRLPDAALDESRVPGHITVLTSEDIRKSNARTLQELLAQQPGVNSFDDIGNSFQGTIDMRGFNASPAPATAVIVDGVRVNESSLGQVNYQLIPLNNIERVEIHPGPSTLYGKNALGGVIHITTKRGAKDFTAEAEGGYGSFNRKKGALSIADTVGSFDYYLSTTKEEDHGYRNHSDGEIGTTLAKLGYKNGEESDISLAYTRVDDRLQQPGSLRGSEISADPRQNISNVDNISRMNQFVYNQRQALPFHLSAALNAFSRDRREDTPLNQGRTSASASLSDMRSQGVTGQLSHNGEVLGRRVITTVGVEATHSKTDSQLRSPGFDTDSVGEDHSVGVFAQNVTDIVEDRLILTTGLRYDQSRIRYRYTDTFTPLSDEGQGFNRTNPRVGLNWNLSEKAGAYALYSEGFRIPSLQEVNPALPLSQNTLKPVRAKNYEIGARVEPLEKVRLHSALFWEDVRDEIYFDPTVGLFGSNINLDRTRRAGVEWGLRTDREVFDAFFNHTYARSTFQTDVTLNSQPFPATQQVKKGDRLPMVPEHRFAAGINVRPVAGWTGSWDGSCASSQRLFGDESNTQAQLPTYCVMNLGGSFEKAGMRFFVKGYNVLNTHYSQRGIVAAPGGALDRYLVPAPGISVFGGMTYRFTAGGAGETLSKFIQSLSAKRS